MRFSPLALLSVLGFTGLVAAQIPADLQPGQYYIRVVEDLGKYASVLPQPNNQSVIFVDAGSNVPGSNETWHIEVANGTDSTKKYFTVQNAGTTGATTAVSHSGQPRVDTYTDGTDGTSWIITPVNGGYSVGYDVDPQTEDLWTANLDAGMIFLEVPHVKPQDQVWNFTLVQA